MSTSQLGSPPYPDRFIERLGKLEACATRLYAISNPCQQNPYNKHPKRKNNDLVAAMYAIYLKGPDGKPTSLEKIGKIYGKTRQAVYDVFRSRGYELRPKRLDGLQILDGIRFTRTKGGYLRGTFNGRRFFMHTYVWEKHNGPVPKGYGIHHKDLNRENNALENLEMLRVEEISSKHSRHYNQFTSPRIAAGELKSIL